MKRWIILAVLVVVISTTATVAVQYLPLEAPAPGEVPYPADTQDSGPKPLVVVDGDLTYRFGMAAQQVIVDKTWEIKNEGQADLVLTKGVIECNCTLAAFDGDKTRESITLKPGQKTKLHLSFETRVVNGAFHKKAEILTNDPRHPSLNFAADGIVHPSVVLYPPESTINYLEISNDQDDHHASILLYSPDQPDIKITKLASSRPDQIVVTEGPMSADDLKAMKVEKGRRVTINVKGDMPLGVFREEVVIKTDHPKQPEVKLTLVGKMVGPISASPERVLLELVHSPKGDTGAITLTVRGLRPTRFEVERKPEKLDVAVTQRDPSSAGGQYLLTVTVPPGMPPGDIDDQIVLKTDHPKAGELKIPVAIRIQGD
jgi:Protein of unknown function (DUF1573)